MTMNSREVTRTRESVCEEWNREGLGGVGSGSRNRRDYRWDYCDVPG